MRSKTLIVSLAAAALLGAGCFSKPVEPTPTPTAPSPKAEAPKAPAVPTPAPVPTATSTTESSAPTPISLPTIDASWNTYTNKQKTFSFQWPTKGRYAPTWEVKYVSQKDAALKDGCYFDIYAPDQPTRLPPIKTSINGFDFCHAFLGDGFAGGFGFVDTYTTAVDGQIVSIVFTKIAHNAAACMDTNPVCKKAFDQQAMVLSYQSGAYALFVEEEYRAHLDQIVGTFRKTE